MIETASYNVLAFSASSLPSQYTPMVYSQWLRSLRFGALGDAFKKIDSDEFYSHYHRFISNLMSKPDCVIRLAVLPDDIDVCLGFSVSREDVLDYVYVQKAYRRLGIAKALVPKNITVVTHMTKTGLIIWQEKYKTEWKFNPFA